MPCSDSSSSICLKLDPEERFLSFDFAKITCGQPISGGTGLSGHLAGRDLKDILSLPYGAIAEDLRADNEESQFILYLEWEALRAAIAQYLGVEDAEYDRDRCKITSIGYDEGGIEVALVVFPPKEMPKILPCSMKKTS